MNELSWLIYAAHVVGNLRNVLEVFLTISAIFGGVLVFLSWFFYYTENDISKPTVITSIWAFIVMVFAIGWVATPTERTIYLIAASEAGQSIINNPETAEMMGDVKTIIKKRLKEELAE